MFRALGTSVADGDAGAGVASVAALVTVRNAGVEWYEYGHGRGCVWWWRCVWWSQYENAGAALCFMDFFRLFGQKLETRFLSLIKRHTVTYV